METRTDDRLAGTRQRKGDEDAARYDAHVRSVASRTAAKAAAMRVLLDLLDERGVAMPDVFAFGWDSEVLAEWRAEDREAFRAVTKALGSTVEHPWAKHTSGGNYRLERTHGPNLRLKVTATWGTCEQVQVGSEVKERQEVVQPAQTRTVVEEVPVYEWRCPDSVLLGELDAAAADAGTPTPAELP